MALFLCAATCKKVIFIMAKIEKTHTTEVALAQTPALAIAPMDATMFAEDAGAGMEGTTHESFAIPFLSVLQKGSPTVDEALPTHIEGHKAGMLFENVTGQVFDGRKGLVAVPCSYRREFLRWGPKESGGGFKGSFTPEAVAEMRNSGKIVELDGQLYAPLDDGTVNDKKCDKFRDTRAHYVLLVDEETGAWKEALLSLSSTQIKKSKMLMSALASVKLKNGSGQLFTPPTFANFVRITTLGESNDKGSWFGVKFELIGSVDRAEIYAAAKALHSSVAKGAVAVKYEDELDAAQKKTEGF